MGTLLLIAGALLALGVQPQWPTTKSEKKALAEKLTAQYESLDDAGRKQLEKLKPYAFPLLLARYVEWAKADEANPDPLTSDVFYDLQTHFLPLLLATCRKEDTDAMVNAWSNVGEENEWRDTLSYLLATKGDPAIVVPIFLAYLRQASPTDEYRWWPVEAVAHSSDPEAAAFMLELLRDPQADPELRRIAFLSLINTGGSEGVQAVLDVRAGPSPRPPWFDTIDIANIREFDKVTTKTDSLGRTWMLFHSEALGNIWDLFIVEKIGSTWSKPLFTGVWTDSFYSPKPPDMVYGIPLAELVADEWINVFPDHPTILQDTDGDGLTDLVETRLGTDPTKADTDGDGHSDLVDPCPNAAVRPLGDTEKIIAAAVEARFFGREEGRPSVISVPGVEPFKMYGCTGTLLWSLPGRTHPMNQYFPGGVGSISFAAPNHPFKQQQSVIRYSPDHQTARTIISYYSGELAGDGTEVTLRKIGDEWFVIDLVMRYVS